MCVYNKKDHNGTEALVSHDVLCYTLYTYTYTFKWHLISLFVDPTACTDSPWIVNDPGDGDQLLEECLHLLQGDDVGETKRRRQVLGAQTTAPSTICECIGIQHFVDPNRALEPRNTSCCTASSATICFSKTLIKTGPSCLTWAPRPFR